ncbi:MAG: S8 family serine peptidase [Sulfolobales archaeon]
MIYKIISLALLTMFFIAIFTVVVSAQDPSAYVKNPKIDPAVARELMDKGYSEAIVILDRYDESAIDRIASIIGRDNIINRYMNIPYIYAKISLNAIPGLVMSGDVVWVAPNVVFRKIPMDRVSLFNYEKLQSSIGIPALVNWGLFRTGTIAVWREFNMTGEGVIIAVLDTGVNINHPLIRGKMYTINNSDPGYPGGWIEFDSKGRPVCSTPHDTDGHGSWTTSIAVGGDTNELLIGYAPRAMYIHALVLPTGSGTFAQVLAGIDWAADPYLCNGVRVSSILGKLFRPNIVSMSFGSEGNYSNYLLPAIRRLLELGIIPVAAIGNGGIYTSSNPGNIWGVFGVGSVERDDTVSLFSSGERVEWPEPPSLWPFKGGYPKEYYKPDFVLPAVMIPGAYLSEDLIAIGSGTSAAAPALSGILALAIQAMRSRGVNVSPDILYDLLSATSYRVDNMSKIRYGNGVVNAFTLTASILGYRLSSINGSSDAESYRVGSRGSFSLKDFQGSFTLYLDDQMFQGSRGTAIFTVPPSDYGDHYVHAFSLDRGIYSYKRIKIVPSISVYGGSRSGNEIFLRLDGFPAVELIIIRYLSTQIPDTRGSIIAIDFPNLRGRIDISTRLPYVGDPQRTYIMASDIVGLVSASIGITIEPPQPQQVVTVLQASEQLQLLISGPQVAYLGETVSINIYPLREGESITSNITVYVYYMGDGNITPSLIMKVQKISENLGISVRPNNTGLYIIWVAAHSQQVLVGEAMYSFRVVPYEEAARIESILRNLSLLSAQVMGLNSSLGDIIGIVTGLRDSYIDLANRYADLYRSVSMLSKELNETKKELLGTKEDLAATVRGVEELKALRSLLFIAIPLMIAIVAVALIIIIKTRRSSSLTIS